MAERDYVLGTHDDEIYRLGLQHRVWRPRELDAWARARIGDGCKVIDFGAGPGFATMDLAEMVGPQGEVHALERSRRFLDTLEAQAKARASLLKCAALLVFPKRSAKGNPLIFCFSRAFALRSP